MSIIKYQGRQRRNNNDLPRNRYHLSYDESTPKRLSLLRASLIIGTLITLVLTIIIGITTIFLYYSLPNVDELVDIQLVEPLKIYTKDKKLMAEIGRIKRTPVTYEQIPEHVKNSFLAAEDSRFFEHIGIDFFSLGRAVLQYASRAEMQTGASTITMQLARTFYLTRTKTLWRKFREILLALKIERELEKPEILTLYLNKIFLGYKSYGIVAAAKNYYNATLENLSIAQAATLAGLPKAPSRFNPVVNPSRALERRDWILSRMLELGYIDSKNYELALTEDITPTPFWTTTEVEAHYAAEMVRLQLINSDLLSEGGVDSNFIYNAGLRVYTTIDSGLQKAANNAVSTGIFEYENRHGYRMAESHFTAFDSDPTVDFSVDLTLYSSVVQSALGQIRELSDFGGQLTPALVHNVLPDKLFLWLGDGTEIILDKKNNFPYQKLYQTAEEELDSDDTSAEDLIADFNNFMLPGDVVRIRMVNGRWMLSQTPKAQASLSSIDPVDGAVRAIIGGFYYYHSEYNRAIQAKRQLGSTIKPLIYSYALSQGFRAGSVIVDTPIRFAPDNNWRPQNSDSKFFGPMTIRKALYRSRNVVSIRLLNQMNIKEVIQFLSQFELSNQYPNDLSLALGTSNATTIDVTKAYSIFANGGTLLSPYLIERIEKSDGTVLYEAQPKGVCYRNQINIKTKKNNVKIAHKDENIFSYDYIMRYCSDDSNGLKDADKIIDNRIAYIMNDILKGIARYGTARKVRELNRPDFGGKTGTTNDNIDAWFTGVHPLLVTSVWLGFDSPASLGKGEGGSVAALPIWMNYTKQIANRIPVTTHIQPDGIEQHYIDPISGDLVDDNYPSAIKEIFRSENLPPESDKIIIHNKYNNRVKVLERPEDIF